MGLGNGIRETTEKAIALSDYIFGNADEEILPIANKNSLDEALLFFWRKTIVARQGSSGSIATVNGETIKTKAYPSEALDTLGAGDAFCGGFITSKMNGDSTEDALKWGNAVASLQINKPECKRGPLSR